jgi:hypothetical protein
MKSAFHSRKTASTEAGVLKITVRAQLLFKKGSNFWEFEMN